MSTPRGQQPLAPLCSHNYPVNMCLLCEEAEDPATTDTTKSRKRFWNLFRRSDGVDRAAEATTAAEPATQGTEESAPVENAP